MKVESVIQPKRKQARTVTVAGVAYRFERRDAGGEPHYVAEMPAEHAQVLLASPHFFEYGKSNTLKRAAPDPAPEADDDNEPDEDAKPESSAYAPDVQAEAAELVTGSASDISKGVGRVSSLAVVRCALELEQGGKARKGVQSILEATIEGATQAGVAD